MIAKFQIIGMFFLLALVHFDLRGQQKTQHPLNPLNWQEYWTLLKVLQKDGKLDADTRFSMINLMEPDKQVVWGWSGGDDVPRSAFALVRQKERSRPNQAKREKTGVSDSGTKPTKN